MAVALNLVPFAGIAFLWSIRVLRDRIGEREDRFFATVFPGSGLLFVAMLFVAAAIAGGLIADATSSPPGPGTLALGRLVTATLVNVYAMRMAAVFTLTTVTIARRTEIVSRWLTVAGLVSALVLLIGIGFSPWVELLFPVWILALSIDILAACEARPRTPRHLAALIGTLHNAVEPAVQIGDDLVPVGVVAGSRAGRRDTCGPSRRSGPRPRTVRSAGSAASTRH